MAKGNVLKEKNKKKKKSSKKKTGGFSLQQLYGKVDKRKTKSITGTLFLLLSVYLFIAFVSYLFTWKQDQDLIMDSGFFSFIFGDTSTEVGNWLGKFGAWVSHLFIYSWSGRASASGYARWSPIKSQISSTSGVSTNPH